MAEVSVRSGRHLRGAQLLGTAPETEPSNYLRCHHLPVPGHGTDRHQRAVQHIAGENYNG